MRHELVLQVFCNTNNMYYRKLFTKTNTKLTEKLTQTHIPFKVVLENDIF